MVLSDVFFTLPVAKMCIKSEIHLKEAFLIFISALFYGTCPRNSKKRRLEKKSLDVKHLFSSSPADFMTIVKKIPSFNDAFQVSDGMKLPIISFKLMIYKPFTDVKYFS